MKLEFEFTDRNNLANDWSKNIPKIKEFLKGWLSVWINALDRQIVFDKIHSVLPITGNEKINQLLESAFFNPEENLVLQEKDMEFPNIEKSKEKPSLFLSFYKGNIDIKTRNKLFDQLNKLSEKFSCCLGIFHWVQKLFVWLTIQQQSVQSTVSDETTKIEEGVTVIENFDGKFNVTNADVPTVLLLFWMLRYQPFFTNPCVKMKSSHTVQKSGKMWIL